ncbi:MAG: acyl-CoA dehydrogenase family protein [Burkholderiaceae bacterium]
MNAMDLCFPGGHGVLVFDGLRVPAQDVLGEIGEGFRYARCAPPGAPAADRACAGWARPGGRTACPGLCAPAPAFGKPLVEHEGVGFMLASNDIDLHTARLHIWHTAWLLDQAEKCNFESSRARWCAPRPSGAWSTAACRS